ncbi:MAG: DUF4230 domain-containing protein [Nocardioides sp.]
MKKAVLLVAVLVVLAIGAAQVPGAIGNKVGDALSSLNPFQEKTVDRTGPSVLKSLTDLSQYHAASAHYETVVDIEKDDGFLPDALSGERVLYVGKGDVDAVVNFGELDERRVVLSDDGKSVTITLPAPTADKPVLDLENSYVASHDEGLINRFSGSELEREAQLKAVEQMTTAAAGAGTLIDLAKENTTAMLRGLFGSLGYTDVTITFDEEPV